MNCISTLMTPAPLHSSHLPPSVLKEKYCAVYPCCLASGSTQQNSIPFRMTVVGDVSALKEVLTRLERSIRTIDVTGLTIESRGNNQALIITAQAFYQPETTIQLKDKEVPR
jgi:hypothetical protein